MKDAKFKALELASNALAWMDSVILKFTSQASLPEPLACKLGCHYCCFNQPMLTPPEALLIGHYVEGTFTARDAHELFARMESILNLTNGKSHDEIVKMRHELPCIFLKDALCSIYEVRPAVCRACSSTSAEHCEKVFESRDFRARLRCYPEIREILQTVHSSLLTDCEKMGCQSDLILVTEAMMDYRNHPRPIEAWTGGEIIFHPSRVD